MILQLLIIATLAFGIYRAINGFRRDLLKPENPQVGIWRLLLYFVVAQLLKELQFLLEYYP